MRIVKFWQKSVLSNLLKTEITEERTYFGLTLIVGVLAGLAAVLVNKAVHFFTALFQTGDTFTLTSFLCGGAALLVSGYITTRHYPSTGGSGIPGVRVALAVYHGKISFQSTLAKFFTSILSLSSGMSLGREGPTVSIAAGIGSTLGNAFKLSKKKIKALVAIGSAGGLAAAFNTPMAAVVFTLEEVVGDLNAKILGSIIIASVIASITAQIFLGDQAHLAELNYALNSPVELFFYLIIGVAASILGPIFTKSVLKFRKFNIDLHHGHKLTMIMTAFLFMAAISYLSPEVLGSGHETIRGALLATLKDWRILILIFALKYIATIICYSSGVSGGLFMPTLLMGATLGGFFGSIFQEFFPTIVTNIGPYALVGMGAFFVAVIRTPFTSIIMVFELTRDYNIILPLMIANIVSYALSRKFHKGSIYESMSEQDGIHLPTAEDNEVLESIIVEDAMVFEPVCLKADWTIKECINFAKEQPYSGFPITKNGFLAGMISVNEIGKNYAKGFADKLVLDYSEKKIISIYPDQSLLLAFHKLRRFQISRIPVVSRINDKKIIGILTAENIVSKFGYHIQEEEHDDVSIYEEQFLKLCEKDKEKQETEEEDPT